MNPETVYDRHADGIDWADIKDHLPRLRESARGNVFEIGVRGGLSTAALLLGVREHGGSVISLDVANCDYLYDDPQWKFIEGHSVIDAARVLTLLPLELDLLFIDSDHTYGTTCDELRIYGPRVKKNGGLILLHDTDLSGAGVQQALEEYAAEIEKVPVYHSGSFGLGELRP